MLIQGRKAMEEKGGRKNTRKGVGVGLEEGGNCANSAATSLPPTISEKSGNSVTEVTNS